MSRTELLAPDFLAWQVELRRWTMNERRGAPHVGVAPLVTVARPGFPLGVSTHSIICGILPRADLLERKTAEFRELYERWAPEGAKAVYDRGIDYLRGYYREVDGFDPASITTLLGSGSEIVRALRADARCQLLFYVFDLEDRSNVGRFRCVSLHARGEVHERGPVFENVWWHNTLFHGKLDDSVVVQFHHQASWDTAFGKLDRTA